MRVLLRTGGRILGCICLVLAFALEASAQQVTVTRPVNLRPGPATSDPRIELLQPDSKLILVDAAPQNGFYHVKAADGKQGWVWSKNVALVTALEAVIPKSSDCDDSLWDHVYKPQRLIVKQQCVAVTGTVVDATNGKRADGVRHEADGDTHGWLDLDPAFKSLLNAGNISSEGGNMVFEIVCMFRVSQADAKTACPSRFHNQVQIPPVGSHVRVVGTYVQDTNHARWMEIHPVTSITVTP
ncbi:MAG: hypothetical protein WAN14_23590 [Candidatus Acidiferrales bacterium]